jgi:hypothetical protein
MSAIKVGQLIFITLSFLLFLDPGSGMGKNQDPGSGINFPDPQHWSYEIFINEKPESSVVICRWSNFFFFGGGVARSDYCPVPFYRSHIQGLKACYALHAPCVPGPYSLSILYIGCNPNGSGKIQVKLVTV